MFIGKCIVSACKKTSNRAAAQAWLQFFCGLSRLHVGQSVQDALKVHRHSDGSECISLLTTELRDRVTEVQQSPK